MNGMALSVSLALLLLTGLPTVHAVEPIPAAPAKLPSLDRAVPATTSIRPEPPPSPPTPAPVKGWEMVMSPTAKWHTSGDASVACPPGKKALGGGHHIVGPQNRLYIDDKFYVTINRPLDTGLGWYVAWYSSGRENFWVNIFAICAAAE
jgi:hypothetical protein